MPPCPLCAQTSVEAFATAHDIEYQTSARTYDFYHCKPCGVLFINPMPVDDLGAIYPPNYYSFAATKKSAAVRVKEWLDKRRFAKLLAGLPGTSLAALDIGGGSGWLLDMIRALDARVTATHVVDIDENAGILAHEAGHGYFQGRFEAYETDRRFDLILMLNLIEHVADPRAVLSKARSLLTPTGVLVIKTPNFDALDARLFRNRSWAGYHTPRHFVLFQRESLAKLCDECGLEITQFAYTQGAPFWSVSMLEELRRFGLVSITPERPAIYHPLMPLLQIGAAGFDYLRSPFAKLSQMELVLKRSRVG